jgi:ubiquinone/menaquinone biosynthesis C-methylase UbiE
LPEREHQVESRRIAAEYERRRALSLDDKYALDRTENLFVWQSQERALQRALRHAGLLPFGPSRRILEVGCGAGQWLLGLINLGATPSQLWGVDLSSDRIGRCHVRLPGAQLHVGDAASLPWPDGTFNIVLQSTVFTSILDDQVRRDVAGEMGRVLADDGVIIWYDFIVNNPRNVQVRGVSGREIRELFPGASIRLSRVTLAPPLSRVLARRSWAIPHVLEQMRVLNTHVLGVIRPEHCGVGPQEPTGTQSVSADNG